MSLFAERRTVQWGTLSQQAVEPSAKAREVPILEDKKFHLRIELIGIVLNR